jgi:2'-5' RNA ligase/GNAT superfamily N-acetyltransferase
VVTGRVAGEIDGLRRALGATALDRVVPHVTLVPPVNVADAELDQALSVVRSAAASVGPIRLELGPPSTFAPVTPVLYLAVGGDSTSLEALRSALLTGPLDVPRERVGRAFVPHVTLDQRISPSRLDAALTALADYRAEVTIERLGVLEHDESTKRWSSFASFAFGRPRIAGRGGLELELSVAEGLPPDLAEWTNRQWRQYSLERYGPEYHPDEAFAVEARVAGEIAGVAEGAVRGLTCRVARLIVGPEWRSCGIGSQLLKETERLASSRGCRRVRLETIAGGDAERFYRRHGYVAVASLPAWREEHDFVLMDRRLLEA